MTEEEYTRVTYDTPVHFAEVLARLNPRMVFCHVSGKSTDGSEKGTVMWARVKGRAENALMRLPFKAVYNFRPGFMKATPGQQNLKWYYKAFGWMYPLLKVLAPGSTGTMRGVARAMIRAGLEGAPKSVLEVPDMNALGEG
jgi:hypothetical protein